MTLDERIRDRDRSDRIGWFFMTLFMAAPLVALFLCLRPVGECHSKAVHQWHATGVPTEGLVLDGKCYLLRAKGGCR
jgi:hypothetical protein